MKKILFLFLIPAIVLTSYPAAAAETADTMARAPLPMPMAPGTLGNSGMENTMATALSILPMAPDTSANIMKATFRARARSPMLTDQSIAAN